MEVVGRNDVLPLGRPALFAALAQPYHPAQRERGTATVEENDTETGTGVNDSLGGTVTSGVSGSLSEQIHYAGFGAAQTVTIDEQEHDTSNRTVDETGTIDETAPAGTTPGVTTPPTTGGAVTDHTTGNEHVHEQDGTDNR